MPLDIVLFITKQRSLFDYEDDNENRSASASLTMSISSFSSPLGLRPRGSACSHSYAVPLAPTRPGFGEAWGYLLLTPLLLFETYPCFEYNIKLVFN